jgi:hypothetical protein
VADPAPTATIHRRRRVVAAVATLTVAAVVAVAVVVLGGGSSTGTGAAPGGVRQAASLVPSDALAVVDLAVADRSPAVTQALAVARRLPDFAVLAAAASSRLGAVLGGGHAVDLSTDVSPWLGARVAVALLNTRTSTAGTLIVIDVSDLGRARAFLRSVGATAHGSYRGRGLLAASNGDELAFVGSELVIGQDAGVRAAIDVASGSTPSLAASAIYRRAVAGQGGGSALDAYASAAGVRRVLADQSGVLGAAGDLLNQPGLQGVAIALTPTQKGASIRIHSALAKGGASAGAFTPTLPALMPATSSLVLDVADLATVAPQVLNAGSAAGVAGGIGPLLARLGAALRAEGANVAGLVSIFQHESAVAIVGAGKAPALVVVARTSAPSETERELAQLQGPLAQLFSATGAKQTAAPVFHDRQVAGVTAHQLLLSTGFQLDYAVFRGIVVITTNLAGIQDVARQSRPLSHDPGYASVLGGQRGPVTSLVFADVATLLGSGQSGLTSGTLGSKLSPDLQRITGVGLTSTRGTSDATTQMTLAVKP